MTFKFLNHIKTVEVEFLSGVYIKTVTHQKTNSGAPTLSRSSQEMVTRSPRLTCFSLDPSTVARGWLTVRRVTSVRIPVVVAACSDGRIFLEIFYSK